MKVLLGVSDDRIHGTAQTNFETNKIGGVPDWPDRAIEIPRCDRCKQQLHLVVQVHCPLQDSVYHRTLYVFGCATKLCCNKSNNWKVLRCQSLDPTYKATDVSMTTETDNHGNYTTDTWGADADDWGDSNDMVAMGTANVHKVTMETTNPDTVVLDRVHLDSVTMETDHQDKVTIEKELNSSDVQDNYNITEETLASFQTLSVDNQPQSENSESDGNDESNDAHSNCIMEDSAFEQMTSSVLMSLVNLKPGEEVSENINKMVPHVESDQTLCAYYMSVFDEPENMESLLGHENELLKDYSMKDGVNIKTLNVQSTTRKSCGGQGEVYEKTIAKHGDKTFHKFQKRLSRCPEQILRYYHKGEPLHIQSIQEVAPRCSCGGFRVFECQLMPALVNLLRFSSMTDSAIEFGVVLIYTCEHSCWTSGDTYRTEVVIVETDSDQKLFKS